MAKYRFKTAAEFIAEFGENWKSDVKYQWNEKGTMDYLLGTDCPDGHDWARLYTGEKTGVVIPRTTSGTWTISKDMITPKKVLTAEAIQSGFDAVLVHQMELARAKVFSGVKPFDLPSLQQAAARMERLGIPTERTIDGVPVSAKKPRVRKTHVQHKFLKKENRQHGRQKQV
jgi:hypothetical protein